MIPVGAVLPVLGIPEAVLGILTEILVGVGVNVGVTMVGFWVVVAEEEAIKEVLDSAAKTIKFLVIVLSLSSVTVIVCSPGLKSWLGDQFQLPLS